MLDNYWILENKKEELRSAFAALGFARDHNIIASDGRPLADHLGEEWARSCEKWEKELKNK